MCKKIEKKFDICTWICFLFCQQHRWSDGSVFDYEKWLSNEPSDSLGMEKCGSLYAFNGI